MPAASAASTVSEAAAAPALPLVSAVSAVPAGSLRISSPEHLTSAGGYPEAGPGRFPQDIISRISDFHR
jgi:hypothetical protein